MTLEEKGGERKSAEGMSGHGDGINVKSCVSWTTAQVCPRTVGSWQEAGKPENKMLQEAGQAEQEGLKWKVQREKERKPK